MGEVEGGQGRSPQAQGVGDLQRWLDFGGTLRVLERSATTVALALCRCDGGEEVDRVVSGDPRVLAFVAERCATGDIRS